MAIIKTVFIDGSIGEVIGQADMPVEKLPNSFALATTMHIGDEDWKVINAEPMTAEEFMQTGELVLTLERIVKVLAKDVLFTLPTLCNDIPPMLAGSTKQGKHVFELHEDDWRQIEFISIAQRNTIENEFANIRKIYRESSINNGHFLAFKNIHVRQHIDAPLLKGILLDQLTDFFAPMLPRYDGIAYEGSDGLIEGGFAFSATSIFYGQHVKGMIKMLGVKVEKNLSTEDGDIAHALQHFMDTYHLYLVDWCRLQLISANTEIISKFLNS
jgi:hypothetical protein